VSDFSEIRPPFTTSEEGMKILYIHKRKTEIYLPYANPQPAMDYPSCWRFGIFTQNILILAVDGF